MSKTYTLTIEADSRDNLTDRLSAIGEFLDRGYDGGPGWTLTEAAETPAPHSTIDLARTVTVGQLIEFAGQFNEEIDDGVNLEYTRGQVELVCDAAGIPMDERKLVEDAVRIASDRFFGRTAP
jgi:hypothetical protein